MQRVLTVSLLLLLLLIAASAQQQKTSAKTNPLYSSSHSIVIPEHERYTNKIVAPDGVRFVTSELIDDPEEGALQRIRVATAGHTFTLRTMGRGAEILWSRDSRWLAVTYTYCCSGFSPYLHVYEVSDSGVRDLKVERALTNGFGKAFRCEKERLRISGH
jgi:hypothetical protein